MSNARIYIKDLKLKGDCFALDKENSGIVRNVLRLKKGGQLEVVDGKGTYCTAKIEKISRNDCSIKCSKKETFPYTSYPKITLLQAFPKGKRLEVVIQKAVELGIDKIILFQAKRCVSVLKKSEAASKQKRLEKIAVEALRQCQRFYLPDTIIMGTLRSAIESVKDNDLKLCMHEDQKGSRLKSWLSHYDDPKTICFAIGPEGGLTESEVVQFVGSGFKQVKLGKEVLRTETAPIAVLSILNYTYRW